MHIAIQVNIRSVEKSQGVTKGGEDERDLLNNDCTIYEREPNHQTYLADKITLDCYVYGTITDYYFDVDYFELVVPESGKLSVVGLLGDSGKYSRYLSIGLKDSNDEVIAF